MAERTRAWLVFSLIVLALCGIVTVVWWAEAHNQRERREFSERNIKKCEAINGQIIYGPSVDDEPLLFRQCVMR